MSIQTLYPFINWVVFLLSCRSSLYILDIKPLSDIWIANISPHSVSCLFTFLFFIFEFYFIFLYSRFLLVINFIHIGMYMSIPISQFIPPPPPPPPAFPPWCPYVCSLHLCLLFLRCKPVHLCHFSRFHIYALIYDICFSLSGLLHSVWQSLGVFSLSW